MSLKLETSFEPALPPDMHLRSQVERILKSGPFRGSETLRNLLSYLGSRAAESPPRPVKVGEIAKSVFGRTEDFDSQTDSIVRVHTGRLRSKLAEFYVGEGSQDDLVLSIPKGRYDLIWDVRSARAAAPADSNGPSPELALPQLVPPLRVPGIRRVVPIWVSIAVAVATVILAVSSAGWLQRRMEYSRVPLPIRTFWHDFIVGQGSPVIVFSTLTVSDWGHPGQQIANSFTTIGEVMGVFDVSRTLSLLDKPVRAKPGALLTWDDAKDTDLVFVGGPLADTPLRDIALFREFQFRQGAKGDHPQPGVIVNLHPHKGEAASYVGDLSRPGQFDYGLIALRPALDPKRHALALAGIDHYGTQAAVEFVTRPDKIQELLSRLNVKNGDTMPSFEALIHVKIHGDVPVQSEILAVRRVN